MSYLDGLQQIRNAIEAKQIFLAVNESTLFGTQYLNILVGTLDIPHVIYYLYNCQPLPCSANSDSIFQAIDDVVRYFVTNQNLFYLLLSDTARYCI